MTEKDRIDLFGKIADEIGYTKQAISESLNLLQVSINPTGGKNGQSSENDQLTNLQQIQE